MILPLNELKDFLDEKHDLYNRANFIEGDPICIPHMYQRREDIEIAGFLAAVMAWGRRDLIIRAARQLCACMDDAPYDYVMGAGEGELERLEQFYYRTFQSVDARGLILGLREVYKKHGGLEAVMAPREGEANTEGGICRVREVLMGSKDFLARSQKHLANPAAGSSAKRLNMYLRWMVRSDGRGVDFGLWKSAKASQLICPLDVHTGNTGRKLGLLKRTQDDWKAALEMTEGLRLMDADDPVRYDFSLFGLGIFEKF